MKNEQRQKDLYEALGTRIELARHRGWGYAIKWFADWEKEYNKKNPLTK